MISCSIKRLIPDLLHRVSGMQHGLWWCDVPKVPDSWLTLAHYHLQALQQCLVGAHSPTRDTHSCGVAIRDWNCLHTNRHQGEAGHKYYSNGSCQMLFDVLYHGLNVVVFWNRRDFVLFLYSLSRVGGIGDLYCCGSEMSLHGISRYQLSPLGFHSWLYVTTYTNISLTSK